MTRAVKAIIRRAAEKAHAPDVELPTISLSNLPPLNGETDLEQGPHKVDSGGSR